MSVSFYINGKTVKKSGANSGTSRVTIKIAIVAQVFKLIIIPQVVFSEESRHQRPAKHIIVRNQNKYDINIRKALELQKDFGNPASALKILDQLYYKIKKKIRPRPKYNKKEAIKVLKAIGGILKKEGNFEYRRNMLLIKGLEKRNGRRFIDCDDYSSIYLVAGERLGLSLEPVYAPEHVFLLCRLDEKSHFYWEPILAEERDIGFYKRWLNIPESSDYPRVLSEKEFESIQLCNLGVAWYGSGNYTKAIENFRRALKSYPDYPGALNNLGASYAKQGELDRALECYKKATVLDLNNAAAFSNMGVAFFKMGNLQKSVEYFEKAIEADPKYERAYNYKIIALVKRGEYKKAFKFLDKINKQKQKTAANLEDN